MANMCTWCLAGTISTNRSSIDFDYETEVVRNIKAEDYPIHFNNAMNSFYLESEESDRIHFLDFAVKLVIADKGISPKENLFLNELYIAWEA